MRLMCEISQSMGENCYFVVDESTNKAIVIDPGENGKKLNKKIDDNNLEVVAICLTHCHFDHVGALNELVNKYHVDVNKYEFDNFKFKVLFTPGHSWDSKTYYFENDHIMFTGDFIFNGTIGRTDLGGSKKDMLKSLNMIMSYPNDILIYPGHGESTTLGVEKLNIKNMFDCN